MATMIKALTLFIALAFALVSAAAAAADITFVWENTNEPGIVSGYTISWSATSSDPENFDQDFEVNYEVPERATVTGLPAGRIWIAIRAYSINTHYDGTSSRLYSEWSNIVELKIPAASIHLKVAL